MSIISVSVFLVVYSSLYNGRLCLDVLYILKPFVEKRSVGLPPSIFIGMIVHPSGGGYDSDEDDEKQVSTDAEDEPVVEPIRVKDEPVENMDDPEPPQPDEDYWNMDVDNLQDSQDEEMSEEDFPRPTYVPFDPENEFGYSTFLFKLKKSIFIEIGRYGNNINFGF